MYFKRFVCIKVRIFLIFFLSVIASTSVDARARKIASADDIESIRFLSSNNVPLKVLVVYMPGKANENFVVSLIKIVAKMNENVSNQSDSCKVHIIPGWNMDSKDFARLENLVGKELIEKYVEFNDKFSNRDTWMQDWGEVGVIKLKGERKPQTVVFDSNRGRGVAKLPEVLASFWNCYLVKNPSNLYSSGDYGGNIEVTPDNVLLIGDTSTSELRTFLEKHGYNNRLAILETDWLNVGHVDE